MSDISNDDSNNMLNNMPNNMPNNMLNNEIEEVEENKYSKYDDLIEDINQHIKRYSLFVDNKYFKEIYSTHKKEEEVKLLKDFSKITFQINNDNDLENFMKYAQQAAKIMENTDGMIGFCKNFAECVVWHIQEIIIKIEKEIKND